MSWSYAIGSYTHRANSFHAYEKDYDLLRGYVDRIEKGLPDNATMRASGRSSWKRQNPKSQRQLKG